MCRLGGSGYRQRCMGRHRRRLMWSGWCGSYGGIHGGARRLPGTSGLLELAAVVGMSLQESRSGVKIAAEGDAWCARMLQRFAEWIAEESTFLVNSGVHVQGTHLCLCLFVCAWHPFNSVVPMQALECLTTILHNPGISSKLLHNVGWKWDIHQFLSEDGMRCENVERMMKTCSVSRLWIRRCESWDWAPLRYYSSYEVAIILVEAGGGLTCNEMPLHLSWQPLGYPQKFIAIPGN